MLIWLNMKSFHVEQHKISKGTVFNAFQLFIYLSLSTVLIAVFFLMSFHNHWVNTTDDRRFDPEGK